MTRNRKTAEPGTGNPEPGEEETTVTLESGGKSVTLSETVFKDAVGAMLGRPRHNQKPSSKVEAETPNIIAPAMPPTETGTETIGPACLELRMIAQRLIDEVREHRHLQDARLLLLVVEKPSVAKALEDGKRKSIGKATKARPLDRLLSSVRISSQEPAAGSREKQTDASDGLPLSPATHYERADFIIRLCGDWLEAIGWPAKADSGDLALAQIDHQLCHCGAKIAGEFIKPADLAAFVEGLGDDHIETCQDVVRDKAVLVRYYWRGETGGYAWVMRKHDVEEFHGVIERHGAWDSQLRKMVDVLVQREDLPLLREIDNVQLRADSKEAKRYAAETILSGQKLADQLSGLRQAN